MAPILGGGCSCGDAETTLGLGQEIDASEDVSFSQSVIYGGLDASLILASLLASPQYQAYFSRPGRAASGRGIGHRDRA